MQNNTIENAEISYYSWSFEKDKTSTEKSVSEFTTNGLGEINLDYDEALALSDFIVAHLVRNRHITFRVTI